jgi:hypothetical protein
MFVMKQGLRQWLNTVVTKLKPNQKPICGRSSTPGRHATFLVGDCQREVRVMRSQFSKILFGTDNDVVPPQCERKLMTFSKAFFRALMGLVIHYGRSQTWYRTVAIPLLPKDHLCF